VSGWWLPMVIWVAVTPGADAVRAAFELLEAELLEPEPGLELEVELDEQAATVNVATVMMAAACQRSRGVLRFMKCLLSHVGWPTFRRPAA
jgi:hypothetical protein